MAREIIIPKNEAEWLELRTKDITSTEISALFGFCPYITEYELWHRKKTGEVPDFQENERMKWGNILQDAIAEGIAKEQGWKIRRMDEYIRGTSLNIGASFDFSIELLDKDHYEKAEQYRCYTGKGLLEIKNVDSLQFKQKWLQNEDGKLEAPLHIEIQVQHQLLCSGRKYAYIGALVGGNELTLLKREANQKVFKSIIEKVTAFWKSIEENKPPEPNFETDSEFISSLYGYSESGKFLDASDNEEIINLASIYKECSEKIKEADKVKKEMKARLLEKIGEAEKVDVGMFSISSKMIAPCEVKASVRKGRRDFRINWSKK